MKRNKTYRSNPAPPGPRAESTRLRQGASRWSRSDVIGISALAVGLLGCLATILTIQDLPPYLKGHSQQSGEKTSSAGSVSTPPTSANNPLVVPKRADGQNKNRVAMTAQPRPPSDSSISLSDAKLVAANEAFLEARDTCATHNEIVRKCGLPADQGIQASIRKLEKELDYAKHDRAATGGPLTQEQLLQEIDKLRYQCARKPACGSY